MSTAINKHGRWLESWTDEDRRWREEHFGKAFSDQEWKDLVAERTSNYGPPPFGRPQCTYCGSITPEDFVAAIKAGYTIDMADWKYGFPHKFYVHWPNPNPTEIRITGRQTQGGKVIKEWTGTYPTLHLKFYTSHLQSWPELSEHSELIHTATGILFTLESDGQVKWKGKRAPGVR